MSQLTAVVTFEAHEGREDELAELLAQMHEVAIADDGCDLYSVLRVDDEPRCFVLVEFYRDGDALRVHQRNPELRRLGATMGDLVASMSIRLGSCAIGDAAVRA
jgi:quinol monooxygenase YgiN